MVGGCVSRVQEFTGRSVSFASGRIIVQVDANALDRFIFTLPASERHPYFVLIAMTYFTLKMLAVCHEYIQQFVKYPGFSL